MKGINKVILVATLGQDPDVRYTADGSAIANLSVATSEQWKDRDTGDKKEKTEWHRVVIFGKLGEIAGKYLRKGSQIYLEGKLQTRKWRDQKGNDRYTTEIVANDMQMLGGKREEQAGTGGGTQGNSRQEPRRNVASDMGMPQRNDNFDDFDDDIPF